MVKVFNNKGDLKLELTSGTPFIGLTDVELRASPVPVSITGGGDATAANQVTEIARLDSILAKILTAPSTEAKQDTLQTAINLLAKLTDTQPVSLASLPSITGTVTANAGTNLNTSLLALETTQQSIKTAVEKIDDAISGSEMQVDIVASLPAGTNYIGKTRLTDGTTDAEVLPLAGFNAQAVAIMDASGNQITSFGSPSTPLFKGSTASFRTLGRAGTAGQKIAAIHNATGSAIKVKIKRIRVDMWQTVVKAVTVAPPIVRIWKFTAVPTNGTVLTKNKIGGSTTSNASCTLWGDASADGVGSATTLTVTLPTGTIIDQHVGPRLITAVGEVGVFEMEFEYPDGIQLEALEGICVFLDYTLATQNPVTDMWVTSIEWEES